MARTHQTRDVMRVARPLLLAILATVATYHLLLTAFTLLSSSLHYPFMDQFRANLRFMTLPFPDSILVLENGHRPILSGLVRVLELKLFSGWPVLQAATAWSASLCATVILLWRVHRDLGLISMLGAAAACSILSLMYWNANARMFIHAYEAVHLFYATAFTVLALLTVSTHEPTRSVGAWTLAIILCVVATFSYGTGMASFCAIAAVGLLRRRYAAVVATLITAVLALVVYQVLLPGSDGVRSVVVSMSPALTLFYIVARIGAVAAEILRVTPFAASLQTPVSVGAGALLIGGLGASIYRRRRELAGLLPLELMGLGLFVFGCTANVLIAVSRTAYFVEHPGQLFAERYIFWCGMAWMGAALYAMAALRHSSASMRIAGAGVIAMVMAAALPPAIEANVWASNTYQMTELQAVAWRLGLRLDRSLDELTDGDLPATYRSIDEMRRRRLNLFGETTTLALGKSIPVEGTLSNIPIRRQEVSTDEPEHRGATLVSGTLPRDVASRERKSQLWLASADGTIVGRAAFTRPGTGAPFYGRLSIATLSGFQGYALPGTQGDLLLVSEREGTVVTLGRLVTNR